MISRRIGPDPRLASTFEWIGHAALCAVFVFSGVAKLADPAGAAAEVRGLGLEPAAFVVAATVIVQLAGSAAILFARGIARAAGAFALLVFTLAATFVGHAFWYETDAARSRDLNVFLEHVGLAGAFLLVAVRALTDPKQPRGD
jgi:uncharacterized membrane protein YphA (DoxX/SURF4 family)